MLNEKPNIYPSNAQTSLWKNIEAVPRDVNIEKFSKKEQKSDSKKNQELENENVTPSIPDNFSLDNLRLIKSDPESQKRIIAEFNCLKDQFGEKYLMNFFYAKVFAGSSRTDLIEKQQQFIERNGQVLNFVDIKGAIECVKQSNTILTPSFINGRLNDPENKYADFINAKRLVNSNQSFDINDPAAQEMIFKGFDAILGHKAIRLHQINDKIPQNQIEAMIQNALTANQNLIEILKDMEYKGLIAIGHVPGHFLNKDQKEKFENEINKSLEKAKDDLQLEKKFSADINLEKLIAQKEAEERRKLAQIIHGAQIKQQCGDWTEKGRESLIESLAKRHNYLKNEKLERTEQVKCFEAKNGFAVILFQENTDYFDKEKETETILRFTVCAPGGSNLSEEIKIKTEQELYDNLEIIEINPEQNYLVIIASNKKDPYSKKYFNLHFNNKKKFNIANY